jgi:hypothetical protein
MPTMRNTRIQVGYPADMPVGQFQDGIDELLRGYNCVFIPIPNYLPKILGADANWTGSLGWLQYGKVGIT